MLILQIHRFYYIKGGAERYFFELSDLLKNNGHKVAHFSMHDKKNFISKWNSYFVSNVSTKGLTIISKIKLFTKLIFPRESKEKIKRIIEFFQPDLVHIHDTNIQISPFIITVIRKFNIPIVQTVNNYDLISPNRGLFHNNKICEVTKEHKYYKAVFHKCVNNSYTTSLAYTLAKYLYFFSDIYNEVKIFIAPSKFMRNKLIEYGIPKDKIIHLPYFINYKKYQPNFTTGNYLLYFGRLSPEKGLNLLLDIMYTLPSIKLKIVGTGIEEKNLKLKAKQLHLKNVEFVGYLEGEKLIRQISNCCFTILPSIWYEVSGISILESFSCGKPVVASNTGGIPEIVESGVNGYLFERGNIEDCANKIKLLWEDPKLVQEMGIYARKQIEGKYGSTQHYSKLVRIYEKVLSY